ncbi:MAG: hypothetical protein WCK49_08650 [Myxococcaceae bacterium]
MPHNATILEWPALSYSAFQREQRAVLSNPDSVFDQGIRGTCGTMAVLHALETVSRDRLQTLEEEVYTEHRFIPDDMLQSDLLKREKHPLALILATHLLNERSHLWNTTYHGTHSDKDSMAEAVTSGDIKNWLKEYFPDRKIDSYSSYCWGALTNALKVNVLWGSDSEKPIVLAFVNSAYLRNTPTTKAPSLWAACDGKGHCVHITTPFVELPDGRIQFSVFTWGETKTMTLSKNDFKGMMWEMIVAKQS